jgi:multidrug efflux pump subunit AcrB
MAALEGAQGPGPGTGGPAQELANVRTTNFDDTPQLPSRSTTARPSALTLAAADINSVLSTAMGGSYINDFIDNGRVKRSISRATRRFRMLPQDVGRWYVRNKLAADGAVLGLSPARALDLRLAAAASATTAAAALEIQGAAAPASARASRWTPSRRS